MQDPTDEIELLVCTCCRLDGGGAEDAPRAGALLFAELAALGIEGVRVAPVACLSGCSRGCTIALRGPDRWTYVYGGLRPGAARGIVAEGAGKYRAAPGGLVPWSERPEHFRRHCLARLPPVPAVPLPPKAATPNVATPNAADPRAGET